MNQPLTASTALLQVFHRFQSDLIRLRSIELLLLKHPSKTKAVPELAELFAQHHAHLQQVEAIALDSGLAQDWPELAELLEIDVEVAA